MSEQLRPSTVYRPGVQLVVNKHIPPNPFGRDYKNAESIRKPVYDLDSSTDRTMFAISHPPVETEPPPLHPEQAESYTLTILGDLGKKRRGKTGGPRVLRCYMDSDKAVEYVAKIYDGVFYPLSDYTGDDCMYLADQDYSREAAAYEAVPSNLQGTAIPK